MAPLIVVSLRLYNLYIRNAIHAEFEYGDLGLNPTIRSTEQRCAHIVPKQNGTHASNL